VFVGVSPTGTSPVIDVRTPPPRNSKGGPGGYLSELIAWDPVKQQKAWGNQDALPWLGGTMTTAGGLVFHGDVRGWFKALDVKTGKALWQFNAGSGISAAPITYERDGKQYVAVVSGRTFFIPVFLGPISKQMVDASPGGGTLFVFELPSPQDARPPTAPCPLRGEDARRDVRDGEKTGVPPRGCRPGATR